jgi:hypothetical protein
MIMQDSFLQPVTANPDQVANSLIQKAHNRDGLPEIAIGITFLAVAGLLWADVVLPPGSPWHRTGALVFGLVVPTLILGSQWAIKKVRRRYLIEKVGYVEFKPANRKRSFLVMGIAFAVAIAAAFAAFKGAFPPASWFLAGLGIFGGALAAIAGRIPRFVIGGVVMAVLGVLIGLSRVSLGLGQAILYGIHGPAFSCFRHRSAVALPAPANRDG